MNAIIIIVVVGFIVVAAILCLALLVGADALQSEEEQLMDDLEQERAIQKWIEKQQAKKDKDNINLPVSATLICWVYTVAILRRKSDVCKQNEGGQMP